MKTKYILTFELRYTIQKDDDKDYINRKYTIDEFDSFDQAVKLGNEFVERLNLDHPSTPGINGDRLGTPIMGAWKKDLIHGYLRNSTGDKIGEIYIKIKKVTCVDINTALEICNKLTNPAVEAMRETN